MVGVHTAVNRAERVARDTRDDDRRRTHTAGMPGQGWKLPGFLALDCASDIGYTIHTQRLGL